LAARAANSSADARIAGPRPAALTRSAKPPAVHAGGSGLTGGAAAAACVTGSRVAHATRTQTLLARLTGGIGAAPARARSAIVRPEGIAGLASAAVLSAGR